MVLTEEQEKAQKAAIALAAAQTAGGATGGAAGGASGQQPQAPVGMPSGYKIQLPTYNGVESPKLRAAEFLDKVESCGIVYGWSDVHKIRAATMNLTHIANTWHYNLFEDYPETMVRWDKFKEMFLERFHRRITPTEQNAHLEKLKQRPTESVDDLMDRCKRTISELGIAKTQIIFYFLQGLHPHIRTKVQEIPTLVTKEDFLRTARAIERAAPSNSKIIDIATIQVTADGSEDDTEKEQSTNDEINALSERIQVLTSQLKGKKKRKKKPEFPRKGGAGGRSGTTGVKSNVPAGTFCYRCRRYGNHMAKQCPVPQEMLATIVPDVPHPSSTFGTYGIAAMQGHQAPTSFEPEDDSRYRFMSLNEEKKALN